MVLRILALLVALLIPGTAQSREASPTESGLVETAPGVSVYFERYGNGPRVILVPNRLHMPEFHHLARPDRTLILYDMRNRGRSARVEDPARITITGDVEDVEALRRRFGAERISLVGYSYLGLMTALYMAQHPDRVERLVQIGPVPRQFGTAYPATQMSGEETLSEDGAAARRAWAAARETATLQSDQLALCRLQRAASSYWLVGNPTNHSRVPDTCVYENEHPFPAQRHLNAHFADLQSRDFPKARFVSLTQPVLTIHGRLDRNAPYGAGLEWAATFPNARLVTVPEGAHQVWLDDPGVLDDIDRFLDGAWPARAVSLAD